MVNWKEAEEAEYRDFLYIEELNTNEGESRRLTGIPNTENVQFLKRAIAQELNNPRGWSDIAVAFAGAELTDLDVSLSSLGIEEGDTIFFTRTVNPEAPRAVPAATPAPPPPYPGTKTLDNVSFKDLDGKTYNLNHVPVNWTVEQLRRSLGEQKHIDMNYRRFIYSGKQLEDNRSLTDYNVQNDSTIHMADRLPGGNRRSCFGEF